MASFSVPQIIENIRQAKKELIATKMFLDEASKLDSYIEHIKQPLLIMVMGEFSTGKSTFINALVGKRITVVDALPTTAVITKLCYGDVEKVMVYYRDGSKHEYDPDEFNRLTSEADDESNAQHEKIDYVERAIPIPVLRDMTIIDSPGLNALKDAHAEATKHFVEQADTVLWMISAEKAATDTEYNGIDKLTPRLKPIVIVNKMDLLDEEEDDPESFLKNVREKLKDKAQEIIGISAEYAVQGKTEGNEDLLAASNIAAFDDVVREVILPNRDAYKVNSLIDELNEWLYGIMKKVQAAEDENAPNKDVDYDKYVENRAVLSRVEDALAFVAQPLKNLCEESTNNASALTLLGILHEFGLVLMQKESQAVSAYEKAAVKNNSFAQYVLATHYVKDNAQDKAVYWLNKAVKADYPLAVSLLAEIERKKVEDERIAEKTKVDEEKSETIKMETQADIHESSDVNSKIRMYRVFAIAGVCLAVVIGAFAIFMNGSNGKNSQNVVASIDKTETQITVTGNDRTQENPVVNGNTVKKNDDTSPSATPSKPSASMSNTNVVATYYVVNCQKSITLRSEPSTSASEITQIPFGKAVGFIETADNGFSKINYDGLVGYGLSSYLSGDKPSARKTERRWAQVVNCEEWITLRSSPSTSAGFLARIPLGAYVTCLGDTGNEFYEVEYGGKHGYALKAYLEYR